VVAKGRVYVASNLQLRIYGLTAQQLMDKAEAASMTPSVADTISCSSEVAIKSAFPGKEAVHQLYGTVCESNGDQLRLTIRSGRTVSVNVAKAFDHAQPLLLPPGRPVHVTFSIDPSGVAHAQKISHSHAFSDVTPADK